MTPKLKPAPKRDKSRLIIGVMLALVLLGGFASFMTSGGKTKKVSARKNEFVTITLPPPPPPPPPPKVEPPKQEEPPKEDEIVEQEPVDLTPPDEPIEAPPSESLGTNITGGNGPDMGLSAGGGNGKPGGRKGGLGGSNPYALYSLSAKSTIESALKSDPVTRKAIINGLTLEFWPDSGGNITRVRIVGSSAGTVLDQAVKRVLIGLRTPPAATAAGMPSSVTIRINARKS